MVVVVNSDSFVVFAVCSLWLNSNAEVDRTSSRMSQKF